MKSILNLVYSTKATLWLLLVFAFAMATATFVEERYDATIAYQYIYDSKWFELVMILLAINFVGNISRYNLLSKKKLAGFLFHSAFIVMIIGAGVTRYFGFEGMMHIREGQSSKVIVTTQQVLKILCIDKGNEIRIDIPLILKDFSHMHFKKIIETKDDGKLEISFKDYLKNPTVTLVENVNGGMDYVKLNVFDHGNESEIFIADKETTRNFFYKMSFNNFQETSAFVFFEKDGKYFLKTIVELKTIKLPDMAEGAVNAGSTVELSPSTQFSTTDNS